MNKIYLTNLEMFMLEFLLDQDISEYKYGLGKERIAADKVLSEQLALRESTLAAVKRANKRLYRKLKKQSGRNYRKGKQDGRRLT